MSIRQDAKDARAIADTRQQLRDLIDREAISIVFQPIVDVRTAEIVGHEALTRPNEGTGFDGPAELFELADQFDLLHDLERLARKRTFEAIAEFDSDLLLFFNNSPPVFTSDRFVETISEEVEYVEHLEFNRIVLEVTERTSPNLIADLDVRALLLREMGFQVAIDDVGAGVNGLNQIMSLRPNWIKLDRELINHIDYDPLKQNLIRTFVRFSRFSSIGLIAEGVERLEELSTLIDLGVTHAQGFYLARPAAQPQELQPELSQTIVGLQKEATARTREDVTAVRLESLTTPVPVYDRSTSADDVRESMRDRLHPNGLIVLDGRRCLGWISPTSLNEFLNKCSDGTTLGSCNIAEGVIASASEILAEALEMVASQSDAQLTLPIIVQKQGDVLGIVPLRNLLRAAARANRRSQSQIEPLTGMPSRVNADTWLSERIRATDPTDVAFIDLCDFDSYNHVYGTDMGDSMLLRLASLIRQLGADHGSRIHYMAHLGGDRFIVACAADSQDMLRDLVRTFDDGRDEFFTAVDLASGAYNVPGPADKQRTVTVNTLRVVYLDKPLLRFSHAREVHEFAAKLRMRKRVAGELWDPILVDRRSHQSARRASA